MLVLLTEEESLEAFVGILIRRVFPHAVEGVDWLVLDFRGKADLQKNISKTMRAWNYGDPHFVITRDNDGGDCHRLKERLAAMEAPTGKPFTVRIVCQQLESWFIGCPEAVQQAYPKRAIERERRSARWRSPDRSTSATEIVAVATDDRTKGNRAKRIAAHFEPRDCSSPSFNVFWNTVSDILSR